MPTNKEIKKIISEIKNVLSLLSEKDIEQFIRKINSARRIFLAGCGRSGILIRTFAMRLMQIGFTTYVVGETITPAIGSGDLLIVVSGSGQTPHSKEILKIAKESGAYTYLITASKNSCMGELAEGKIIIPGPTKLSSGKIASEQIAGSLFEQGTFIFLECSIQLIIKKLNISHQEIMLRHTNLE